MPTGAKDYDEKLAGDNSGFSGNVIKNCCKIALYK